MQLAVVFVWMLPKVASLVHLLILQVHAVLLFFQLVHNFLYNLIGPPEFPTFLAYGLGVVVGPIAGALVVPHIHLDLELSALRIIDQLMNIL